MFEKKVYDSVALTAGAGTDILPVVVDFNALGQTTEFILAAKIVGNATAPGAARTVTPNLYWSDELLATIGDAPTILAARKFASAALAVADAASATRQYQCVVSTGFGGVNSAGIVAPFRPLARFLYLTITKTTEDAGAISTLTMRLVGLRKTSKRLSD